MIVNLLDAQAWSSCISQYLSWPQHPHLGRISITSDGDSNVDAWVIVYSNGLPIHIDISTPHKKLHGVSDRDGKVDAWVTCHFAVYSNGLPIEV